MALVEIPDDQAEALKAIAAAQGLTLAAWLIRLAQERSSFDPQATRGAVKQIRDIQKRMHPYPEGWTVRDYIKYGRH